MSERPYETIDLPKGYRIAVFPDTDAPNPREDWDTFMTSFVSNDEGYSQMMPPGGLKVDDICIVQADARFASGVKSVYSTPVNYRVARWALIYHQRVVRWDYMRKGYWHITPGRAAALMGDNILSIEKQNEIIDEEIETYEQWAEGRVSYIELQENVHYVRLNEKEPTIDYDATIDRWERVEGIGDSYLTDDYTAAEVVLEHLVDDVPKKVRKAVEEMVRESNEARERAKRRHDGDGDGGGDGVPPGGAGSDRPADQETDGGSDGERGESGIPDGGQADSDPEAAAGHRRTDGGERR